MTVRKITKPIEDDSTKKDPPTRMPLGEVYTEGDLPFDGILTTGSCVPGFLARVLVVEPCKICKFEPIRAEQNGFALGGCGSRRCCSRLLALPAQTGSLLATLLLGFFLLALSFFLLTFGFGLPFALFLLQALVA